jgi:hypothetical protein
VSIYTPEVGTKYGALDSAVFVDGVPFSAHLLRAMAMSANRLTLKGQPLLNLVWPTRDTLDEEDEAWAFEGLAWPYWSLLVPRLPVFKRPLLNRAAVRCRLYVASGETCYLQFGTRGCPFQPWRRSGGANVLEVAGGGAWTDYSLDDVPLHDGTEEWLEVWVRGEDTGTAMDEGTYGANNAGTHTALFADRMEDSTSAWNVAASSIDNPADGGHYLSLENSGGTRVVGPRDIIWNSATALSFLPALTRDELSTAGDAGYYSIYTIARIGVANIALAAQARSA